MATKGDISGLDVLAYGGVPKIPVMSGFTLAKRSGVVQSSSPGGMTRQRKKYYGNTYIAEAKFIFKSLAEQDYMRAFFQVNEGKKFICHLRADRPVIEPHVVQLLSEWPEGLISRKASSVTVTLEITRARCDSLDVFLNAMYSCHGDDICQVLTLSSDGVVSLP